MHSGQPNGLYVTHNSQNPQQFPRGQQENCTLGVSVTSIAAKDTLSLHSFRTTKTV